MIRQTSPDKVRGRLVKYKLGDCLGIHTSGGKYLGAIMTGKYNKYYNLTLLEYLKDEKPALNDFMEGKLFGTLFGSREDISYAVDQKMVECAYIDSNPNIEVIGRICLTQAFLSAGYSYIANVEELHASYLQELPVRIRKSAHAEKYPELAFAGQHLVDVKSIQV